MLLKFGLRNMMRNRRRTLVAISTISVGVFALLFLKAFFAGLLSMHAENSIHSRHGHGQITTKGYWGQTFEKPMDHWLKDPERIIEFVQKLPQVKQTFPRVQFFALLSNGRVNVSGRGQGIDGASEKKFFDRMNFIEGGPIGNQEDGLVLGVGLARALGIKVGDQITVLSQTVHGTLNGIDTMVTGIFHVGFKEADDMLFQIQLSQAKRLLDTPKIESIAIGLHEEGDFEENWKSVTTKVSEHFSATEILSVYVLDQVWAENGRLFLTALMNIFSLTFLGVILLAIYNSSATTVVERKRELGMLRANGESKTSLIFLLLIEGTALAVIGAIVGVGLVILANILAQNGIVMPPTPGTNRSLAIKLAIDPGLVATVVLFGIGTSVFGTFLSTLQILQLSIRKALRNPT